MTINNRNGSTTTQWGLQTPDGEVHNITDYPPVEAWNVKGQRTRIVKRAITVLASDWESA